MLDTSARLLRLLSFLQSRPDWTVPELAERLGVTIGALRRDVARLRELGYPIQAALGVTGGYRLAAGPKLPPLLFDDDEAVAIVLSLRTATSHTGIAETSLRALTKLERLLPPRLRRRTTALREATVALTSLAPTADPEILTLLAEACQARTYSPSATAPATAKPATAGWSRTGSCTPAAAGIYSPATTTATAGAPSASIGSAIPW